jgi:opacity protein-like surface antigen
MRKMLMCAAVAASLAGFSHASKASDSNGETFVNGSVGQSKYHGSGFDDNSDTGAAIYVGYRWSPEQRFWIGPELGFVDLGKLTQQEQLAYGNGYYADYTSRAKSRAMLLGVNMKWALGEQMYLVAHGGIDKAHTTLSYYEEDNFGYGPSQETSRVSKNSWYAGATLGYNFNRNFGLGVSYDNYNVRTASTGSQNRANASIIGVTAEVRF